uniref:Uncharacterized protein n=1 Tax=Panagrolaimus davidi TaxID=227884 RepID=A0A914QPP2_9BILA
MSSSILPRRQNKRRNVEQEFRIAYQTSDEELIKFMHENDENLAVAIEYFSEVLEVRVNHKEISILQVCLFYLQLI